MTASRRSAARSIRNNRTAEELTAQIVDNEAASRR